MARRIQIRRVLTDTPLARQHEHRLAGRVTQKRKPIPWASFDRSKYPAPALALACDAQTKLALGEYGAVDLFAHLASAMTLNGVPFDLVAAAARIPSDEIRHADFAMRMAKLISEEDVTLQVDREGLGRRWKSDVTLDDLDLLMLEVAAIGETLACALLSACLERATDATAHALFASIVADEVHHARLGWYYLAWRSPQWSRPQRQRAADHAGQLIVQTEKRFSRGRDAPPSARKAARALGVLESRGQQEAVHAVMKDEIVPALDALGLGASHAWRVRERAQPSP